MAIAFFGVVPVLRFLWVWANGGGNGHIQSLVIGGVLLMLGALVAIFGVLADLMATNRKLIEASLTRLRHIEARLDAAEGSVADDAGNRSTRQKVA